MADIFLSYAREDRARIEKLSAALEAEGFSVWWDRNLAGGSEFSRETEEKLNDAKVVLVSWSNASVHSMWVADEATVGRDKGSLVPVLIDDVPPKIGFRQIQCIDLISWRGERTADAFAELAHAIRARLDGAVLPPPAKPSLSKRLLRPAPLAAIGLGAAALIAVVLVLSNATNAPRDRQGESDRIADTASKQSPDALATAADLVTDDAPEKSVAVLPFVALSSGEDDGYFADGLTEEIINALTTLPDLLVTARTSAFHFKGKDTPVPDIAKTLGVAHVVEGSVRRSGDKVRITAQLIRATDGFHLWSETYDRPVGDEFSAQTDIAESVARALGLLLDENARALMADAGVRDVEAFLAYRRGRDLFNLAHSEGPQIETLARANKELEAAIARKPDFAAAWLLHADLYGHILTEEAPGKGASFVSAAGIGAEEAARRLGEDLEAAWRNEKDPGQRLLVQALRTTLTSDWRNLEDEIARGYERLNTCRNELWYGRTARVFGFAKEVHARDEWRTHCDPFGVNWGAAAESAVWVGSPETALAYADRAETLRGPRRHILSARILAYLALGRLDEADALLATGDFGAAEVPEAVSLLVLQVPAAQGRVEAWARLRPTLERDPERRLVGAAVFGDRAAANRAAAEIDAMTFGPNILVRATDRCGCGVPFDLAAAPNFARLVREGGLSWSPPSPIKFPLKDW